MKLSAIITHGVAMVFLPRSCIAERTRPAPAPRAAPVQLSSPNDVQFLNDVTLQLNQQSNTINAAQVNPPVTPKVITVNFDPVANAQSNQEPIPFFEQPIDPEAAQNLGAAAQNVGASLLRGGVPTVP
jgi:hypothetical protein